MRFALLTLLALSSACAQASAPTPIFVLHAYGQEYPWTKGQHQGFVQALAEDTVRAYLPKVEYLDTKRAIYNTQYADFFGSYLQTKYQGYRPAAIYVSDDNALSFARSHLNKVFPGVPIFFSGVNNYDVRQQIDPTRITGVFEKKEIAPNLRLMRQIDPNIREIVIVGDASETYQAIEREIRKELAHHADIRATFLSGGLIEDLMARLKKRKERFVFLTTLGAMNNREGRTLTLPETVEFIVSAGNFVVFSMEDAYLYPGVLGGYVTSGHLQGRDAAQLLIRHLSGTPMADLLPTEVSPNEYILDETELEKAGLVLSDDIAWQVNWVRKLPTFYETNRTIILGTLYGLAGLLLVSLIAALLLYVRKNRQIARTSRQLGETKESLDRAQRIAHMGNWDWQIAENHLFCSEGVYRLFGMGPAEQVASYESFMERIFPEDRKRVGNALKNALKNGSAYDIDHRIVRQDGMIRIVHGSAEVVRDKQGNAIRISGTLQDVSEQRQAEQLLRDKDAHLEFVAYHDALTGLPNRALLMDRLHHAVSRSERSDNRMALLFIDLDRFKTINDSLGHAVGDTVLMTVADRLKVLMRGVDTLSRLGGDEFVVLIEDIADGQNAANVAEKVLLALEKVMTIGHYPLHVSASIGISLYPEDGRSAAMLLKHADAAMYKSKEGGRNTFHFYEKGMTERAMRRVHLESRLRAAFAEQSLEVFYQPLVNLETGCIYGAEALMRWFDSQEGAISPDHFIPLAEDTGLIIPMGEWVIHQVCLDLKKWESQGVSLDGFAMHVNLSVKQLMQKGFPERLTGLLAGTSVSPSQIVLELTESSIMESETLGRDVLTALRQIGVSIAIDDFGTGHSSLSRLKQLPIGELKIDRSFIRDIDDEGGDAAIVQTILALSSSLGLSVIAEGVEHASQADFLRNHGCVRAQGYYYARAMPAHAFLSLLLAGKPLADPLPAIGDACVSPGLGARDGQ
ncbi:MAG TPA: EAL domain-containing protein [Thiobacillus sp.]